MPGLFISKYVNKVDKKGRVSVPAEFRKVLAGDPFQGVFLFPSLQNDDALEAYSSEQMQILSDSLEDPSLPQSHLQVIETRVFGAASQLPFDSEGRIVLPQALQDVAGITEEAAFVGKRRSFELWNPARYEEHQERVRQLGRTENISLSSIIARAGTMNNGRGDRS